ncbi:hypothetical protein NQ314_008865 [Rhamnusium bicolor]|uniref:URB1 N-terminal domain-containing protein n=1 Tax=Rhamnusium bicolor TaxID=1586634 RepID=A0AAV8Y521_9CUCU|nr:hypothetical protein NQ314_008865 [Rhamnusium bicolor]
MEQNEELSNKENKSKKHTMTDPVDKNKSENIKKLKFFSPKEFRKELSQGNRLAALKQFLSAINASKGHDYVFEYLESGGNCLELLQCLELDSTIPPVLIFELVSHLLLKITVDYAQYHGSAYESCRYILNNYVTIINKMINLSSSSQERKVCLRLLTAMVTFSSTLAKDVLLHVNFHSTNVELLTKNTGEKDSVRDHFIHFLTAYLVDGHYPTLSIMLEKKGFITSIINGLQFDAADTVCVVISAMKNHILQNPSVSKTAKMKTFNTSIVRDIVNLYNWKGPEALKTQQKKNKNVTVTVDEYSKAKVSECVHDFLLILCTSHKFGVIFKDFSMSLGRKNQNSLMYTVLESLERPWEHSYACDLVTKICGACPDLTKTMWNNLKPFLEPRQTQKWLNAMRFAKILLKELQPTCIEFCVKELGVYQLAQIIQFLVAPLPILKTIIPENHIFESPSIKQYVVSLLLEMLRSLDLYLAASVKWCTPENHKKLKKYITIFVTRNFLDAKTILDDWETKNEFSSAAISQSQFLEVVCDIFEIYRNLAPQLLDSLNGNVELTQLLVKLRDVCDEEEENLTKLQIKIIDIFVDLDQSKFSPKAELFSFVVPLMFKFYYDTTSPKALSVLRKLLKNTGIFEGCLYEINIWINGILDLKSFDENVAQSLVEILKVTSENALKLSEELSKLKSEKRHCRKLL